MLTVLGLLACGAAAARGGWLPEQSATVLDRLVITLALPALVLATIPDLALDADTLVPVGVAWGQHAVLSVVIWVIGRARRWSSRTMGTMLLCVPLGNTSFLGVPAVDALLGSDHVGYAIVYDQLGSFLILATWGTFLAARYGGDARPTPRAVLRRILTFPPFVALVVAVASRWTGLPGPVTEIAEVLGATLVPMTMLAIGLRLRLPHASRVPVLATGLTLRMVVAPLAVLGVATVLGGDGPAWDTAVLEAGMPPMVTAAVVAIAAGLDEELATALTGAGILLALLTLPGLALLL